MYAEYIYEVMKKWAVKVPPASTNDLTTDGLTESHSCRATAAASLAIVSSRESIAKIMDD